MRIAIITLHLTGNYGGILQNYALQKVLTDMGHTVETVQVPWQWKLPLWRMPLSYGKRCLKKYVLRRDCRIFYEQWYNATHKDLIAQMQEFVKQHIRTRYVKSFSVLRKGDYDALIVGSDQIWRPKYSYKPITLAYLSFARHWKAVKRIAYAASFGTEEWEYTPEQTAQCASLAQLFDVVSVREKSAVSLCKEHFGVKAVHVLDPTMLLSVADYRCLFEGSPRVHRAEGQLLTYVLDASPAKDEMVKRIAAHYQYKPFRANSRLEEPDAPLEERKQPPVEQWLSDFYNAEFVVTDSFHATVFSILFGKPFVVIGNKERGLSRIYSLLEMFGLEKHIVYSIEDLDLKQDYEYDAQQVNERLRSARQESILFLQQSLS